MRYKISGQASVKIKVRARWIGEKVFDIPISLAAPLGPALGKYEPAAILPAAIDFKVPMIGNVHIEILEGTLTGNIFQAPEEEIKP